MLTRSAHCDSNKFVGEYIASERNKNATLVDPGIWGMMVTMLIVKGKRNTGQSDPVTIGREEK